MWTVGEESRMNWEVSTDTYTLGCVCSVLQSCATLWDAMDCSPPASSVQGMLQALLQGDLPDSGIGPHSLCLLHCRQILHPLSHPGSALYTLPCVNRELVGSGSIAESSAWGPVMTRGMGWRSGWAGGGIYAHI